MNIKLIKSFVNFCWIISERRDVKNIKWNCKRILHVTNKIKERNFCAFLKKNFGWWKKINFFAFFFIGILIDLENIFQVSNVSLFCDMNESFFDYWRWKFMQKVIGGKLFKSRWNSSLMAQNKEFLSKIQYFLRRFFFV